MPVHWQEQMRKHRQYLALPLAPPLLLQSRELGHSGSSRMWRRGVVERRQMEAMVLRRQQWHQLGLQGQRGVLVARSLHRGGGGEETWESLQMQQTQHQEQRCREEEGEGEMEGRHHHRASKQVSARESPAFTACELQ